MKGAFQQKKRALETPALSRAAPPVVWGCRSAGLVNSVSESRNLPSCPVPLCCCLKKKRKTVRLPTQHNKKRRVASPSASHVDVGCWTFGVNHRPWLSVVVVALAPLLWQNQKAVGGGFQMCVWPRGVYYDDVMTRRRLPAVG
jgi:hypothetical protein